MKDSLRHILRKELVRLTEARHSNYEVSDEPYANIFFTFINEYNRSTGYQKANLRQAFQYAIREYTMKPHKLISKKIADHFIEHFPNVNPFQVRWNSRKKYGVVNGKSFILFEHTTPVKTFLLELAKCSTLDEVKQAMRDYSGICLVTRDEDDCLRQKGFNVDRADGWRVAYRACDIEVMDESQFNNYKFQNLEL